MAVASNTRLIRGLIAVAAAALFLLAFAGGASASDEPEYSLSASPGSISWPDAPGFQYRLEVKAGSEPLSINLKFPSPDWGDSGPFGSVFRTGEPRLEGPGELIPGEAPPIPDLMPGTCIRGANPWISAFYYQLDLAPGEETLVIADSRLAAAPLASMERAIKASLWSGNDKPTELTAPLAISGPAGVLINARFVGETMIPWIKRFAGQQFRLSGSTTPALNNQKVRITAQQAGGGAVFSNPILLGTVRTDGNGNFRTEPLFLYDSGTWALRATLVSPGEFDSTPACAGAVIVQPAEGNLTEANLNGHIYRSIRIKGRKMGRKRIRFNFFRHASTPTSPKAPTLGVSAGCNLMGARYLVSKGRLRWTGPVMSTMMGCTTKRMRDDRWLQRNLRRGMKAALKGKRLTLTRGKVRIVLRQTK